MALKSSARIKISYKFKELLQWRKIDKFTSAMVEDVTKVVRRVGQTSESTYKSEFQSDLRVQLDFILSIFSKFGKDGTEKFCKNQNFVQIRGATTMEKN